MPIKKIHVGFDIDMDVFMKMLQHGSSNVRVEFTGEAPKVKPTASGPKLLTPPVPIRSVVLDYFKQHKDEKVNVRSLFELVQSKGFAGNSAYSVLHLLVANKHVKKIDKGLYQLTASGANYNG